MRYFYSSHHLTGAFAAFLAVVMLLPGEMVPSVPSFKWTDKVVHLALFVIMSVLSVRSARASGRVARPVVTGAGLTLAYALVLEALQGVIPGRSWDSADLVAGALGILGAALLQSVAKQG